MRRFNIAVLIVALLYILGIIGLVFFKVFGPFVENAIYPPVRTVDAIVVQCSDEDMYFQFFLDKTFYFGDTSAELTGLTIFSEGERLPWQFAQPADRSSFSAPAGEQVRDLVVVGGCGRSFTMVTTHVSPVTGLKMVNRWGPFLELPR